MNDLIASKMKTKHPNKLKDGIPCSLPTVERVLDVDSPEAEIRLVDGGEVFLTGWRHHTEKRWRSIRHIYRKPKNRDCYDAEGDWAYAYA